MAKVASSTRQQVASRWLVGVLLLATLACLLCQQVAAGGGRGGKKGGMEDIILYNGNIVMRGDKKGGSIVMANSQANHEEVEFAPSFFSDYGAMGGGYMRRR